MLTRPIRGGFPATNAVVSLLQKRTFLRRHSWQVNRPGFSTEIFLELFLKPFFAKCTCMTRRRNKFLKIGYARVSTEDQTTKLQIEALEAAGCERIFQETASGAKVDRQELLEALEFARLGDCIVVWKLDRLARSLAQLIEVFETLEKRGIGLTSVTESIDTTTPGGRLVFHIFGALAEFERSIIRERTRAGLAAAKRLGRIGGRPRSLSEKDIQAAKALLRDPTISPRDVATRMSVSLSTLYRYIPSARECV